MIESSRDTTARKCGTSDRDGDWSCIEQFGRRSNDYENTVAQIAVGGHQNDSTRAECLGALVGIARPGPAHFGIDSSSCIDALVQILRLATHIPANADLNSDLVRHLQKKWRKGNLTKPWNVQYNGDMHLLLLKFVIHKNPKAIAVTKAKGHAKREHIEAGLTTAERALGNAGADKNADEGQECTDQA